MLRGLSWYGLQLSALGIVQARKRMLPHAVNFEHARLIGKQTLIA